MARTFDDVQAFFEFLTVINDATKRVTVEGTTVDLFTNLDPSGDTNLAIELAKIYTWYQNMVNYNSSTHEFVIKPAAVPAIAKNAVEGYYNSTDGKFYEESTFVTELEAAGNRIYIDKSSNVMFRYDTTDTRYELLSTPDTTYDFREGSVDGAFQYLESSGSTWQTVNIHNAATLDSNGKVPSSQLPSFVDDVIEGYLYNGKFYKEAAHTTEIPAESGKIYVDIPSNKTYRYGGSSSGYVEISESLALGETSSTAYRGDRGKTAYDHSQVTSGNPHNVTKSDVNLGNVDNTADAGAWLAVKFTVTNTGAVGSLQLNVNSTGGAPIKYRNANLPSAGTLAANRVYLFVYDGTNYQLIGDLDTDQNTDLNMRQTLITTTDAKLRPLLMSYAQTSSTTGNIDNIGYRMNTVYIDTSDGSLHIPKIVSDNIVDTSGNAYVNTGDTLILHCNSKPELWS